MASDVDASETELSVPIDYVPGARGHGILTVGRDSDGADALAIWRLSPTGLAGGAWVVRFEEIQRDPEQLGRIVWMLQDRCLVDWTADTPTGILDQIAHLLPTDLVAALRHHILTIPDLLTEIIEHRASYAKAVERHRTVTKSKLAPLAWATEMPDPEVLMQRAGTQSAAASPVAAAALALTSVVATTAQLWQDTEQARYRRTYLRSLGEPQPLPPRWLARLRAAVGSAAVAPV
ncbi:DUF6218 family protein [Micromonospora sp. DR5-3]|uniref:DUF6218 family protein n=1 Tax=unclassified Micromonospora TaxID=2617518 RepID=UPI0011DB5BBB|nr:MULTISPECIES: DUF6218 family protein [unclassified Micromonospora]MCW3817728.1 DUF6218 family protein [Micromonospora sp. DR5-3]TYC20037.1 hypothetical protein FXF52_33520 [Micromonospora sp. MP36]